MSRLAQAGRLYPTGTYLNFVQFLDDFPFMEMSSVWVDTYTDLVHIFINTLSYLILDIFCLLWYDDNEGGFPCRKTAHTISF